MKKSLQDFYLFVKKPKLIKKQKIKPHFLKDFTSLFLIDFVFAILLTALFYILLHFDLVKEYPNTDFVKEYGVLGTLLIACILAPVLEECFFRWHLRDLNGSIYFICLSLSALIASQLKDDYFQLGVVIAALLTAALIIKFLRKRKIATLRFWKKAFPFIFYYTAIVFGYVHLSNHQGLTVSDPSFIIYIASQIFGGFSLGYIRVKYGLIYSILFHAFFNLVAFSLIIFFPDL